MLLTDNGVCRSAVVKFVILLLTLFTIANRAEELLLFKKKNCTVIFRLQSHAEITYLESTNKGVSWYSKDITQSQQQALIVIDSFVC